MNEELVESFKRRAVARLEQAQQFGVWLKGEIEKRGWDLDTAGARFGYPSRAQCIQELIAGRGYLMISRLQERIAQALEIDLIEFREIIAQANAVEITTGLTMEDLFREASDRVGSRAVLATRRAQIGAWIEQQIVERGWDLDTAGAQFGYPTRAEMVQKLINGTGATLPSMTILARIAERLGTTIQKINCFTPPPRNTGEPEMAKVIPIDTKFN